MTEQIKKPSSENSRIGWLMLGIVIDYFIFRPVRSLRVLGYIVAGFILGFIYAQGLDRIAAFIKNLLV